MIQGFYNENQFRDFPFIRVTEPYAGTLPSLENLEGGPPSTISPILYSIRRWIGDDPAVTEVSKDPIVDFFAIMGVLSGYQPATDKIWLDRITADVANVVFRFKSSVSDLNLGGAYLEFTATTTPGFQPVRGNVSGVAGRLCSAPLEWEGFLTVADLDQFVAEISTSFVIDFPAEFLVVEPARVQTLAGTFVNSINIANFPRTTVDAPNGCDPISSPTDIVPYGTCFSGDVQIKEGFNAAIRQDRRENTLTLGAGVGLGEGEPCEEVPNYPSEASPDDGEYLTGGARCSDIVTSINGVGGSNLTLRAGAGFRIIADPADDNTLIVNRALDDFALCVDPPLDLPNSSSIGSVSESDSESASDSDSGSSSAGG